MIWDCTTFKYVKDISFKLTVFCYLMHELIGLLESEYTDSKWLTSMKFCM
jgi:hypothetical protein